MNARLDLSLSRREFLKASGALIISAGGPAFIGEAVAQTAAGVKPPLVPTELDSWVAILPDGKVTAFFGKMDMGQSLDIAIAISSDWPMSILPKKAVTLPSGRIATQESSSVGTSGGLTPAAVCATASPMNAGPPAEIMSAPEAFRNSRRESDRSRRAFMSFS